MSIFFQNIRVFVVSGKLKFILKETSRKFFVVKVTTSIFINCLEDIKKGLKNFKGVQRRFNKIFTFNGVDFYDDYAHHPTEIKSVLEGVKKVFDKCEKVCVFQPHRISRLKDLRNEFTHCFRDADTIILCPIFTAGEKIKLDFNYNDFAKGIIKNSKVKLFMIKNNIELAKFLKQNIYGNKIVIGMGAGSISNWMKKLPELM